MKKLKTKTEMLRSLVGSEMCIRDRFDDIQMAIFRYCIMLQSRGWACRYCVCWYDLDPIQSQGQGHGPFELPTTSEPPCMLAAMTAVKLCSRKINLPISEIPHCLVLLLFIKKSARNKEPLFVTVYDQLWCARHILEFIADVEYVTVDCRISLLTIYWLCVTWEGQWYWYDTMCCINVRPKADE